MRMTNGELDMLMKEVLDSGTKLETILLSLDRVLAKRGSDVVGLVDDTGFIFTPVNEQTWKGDPSLVKA